MSINQSILSMDIVSIPKLISEMQLMLFDLVSGMEEEGGGFGYPSYHYQEMSENMTFWIYNNVIKRT